MASRTHYERIRNAIFQKMMFGQFDQELEEILSLNFEFKLHELTYIYPLGCDLDSCNKKSREILYQKKIDILLKLATHKPFSPKETLKHENGGMKYEFYHARTWDLKKDFDAEALPDKVINAIKICKNARRVKSCFLPHFFDITKVGTQVTMVTSCPEMTLRSIIGRRSQVRAIAPTIIFWLLLTLKRLQDMNMVNQRICP